MKIIVGCEESQTVCNAFRAKGHEAFSCDIVPTRGEHLEWHIQGDARLYIRGRKWDVMIAFPPCDHLAVSGARWFKEKREDGRQRKAIEFFLNLWESQIEHIAIENPISVMSGKRTYLKKWFPDLYERAKALPEPQIIQPWMFGHGETKATCLWLKNLPKLVPTNIVYEDMMRLPKSQRERVHHMTPGPNRSRDRAKTYSGIADAMSNQWSDL